MRCKPGYLLRAAKHLGLKAKLSRTSIERLALTPLPALALMRGADDSMRVVILAQCDGKRVLFQDPGAAGPSGPTIEPIDVFAQHWTGELILITSRASLAGELAKFDFSWFIPALVKYRKLLGEVLLISFVLQLFGLVSPLFFQVVMDKVLVHKGQRYWGQPKFSRLNADPAGAAQKNCDLTPKTSSATPPAASMLNSAPSCSATW